MTPGQVVLIMGPMCSKERAEACAPSLTNMLGLAEANTVTRAAAMIAQIAWETGQLRFLIEDEEAANAYEWRKDLGNNEAGDGLLFRGRGYIHLTGRHNYFLASAALGFDFVGQPDLAAELGHAGPIAAWYWRTRRLNELSDQRNFRGITRLINGATTDGPPSYHERREKYYRAALEVFGLSAVI